ncbi:MAG: hypothetical protein OXN91_00955 [Chloroflexota bacterium]|nr:hypothetical protein [Chloroflexota bacterium]
MIVRLPDGTWTRRRVFGQEATAIERAVSEGHSKLNAILEELSRRRGHDRDELRAETVIKVRRVTPDR